MKYITLLLLILSITIVVDNRPIQTHTSTRHQEEIGNLFDLFRPGFQYTGNHSINNVKINTKSNIQYSPIILVGGLGGSALMSQRNQSTSEPHWWCEKTTDPFQIWLSVKEMVPFFTEDCFVNDMSLILKDGLVRQKDSRVKIFGKDVGGLDGLNSILSEFQSKFYYMKPIADFLVANGNYQVGKSLRGFTYDWRLSVREWANNTNSVGGDFFILKKLIEDTYTINGNVKVSLLGHSMGAPFLQYFLANFVNQAWKDQYIYNYIPVAGPFDGSPFSLILFALGTNWQIPTFEFEKARKIVREFPSVLFMSPNKFPYNYPFFTYGTQNYHVELSDIENFFSNAQVPNGYKLYQHEYSQYKNNRYNAPNVTTHCIYGYGIPTVTHIEYSGSKELKDLTYKDVLNNMNTVNREDGDGTVPLYSMQICDEFAKYQQQQVHVHRFFNSTHGSIMNEERVFRTILNILQFN
ncbi:predicted protein [Naegleria gruberi]|uniref:Predicted protein n=1 Tax=Naegleria gruberi TaxID=5762 RepID=D2V3S6_NAEGR|nr:uncharacterized protein NAEGRDRAFT_63473 [Naegleria gruberi]EFC48248.1 predicted protein [Naegleria gruberi]|eukprot:XP_002680992.1 predicted protein [Naegleria gruberi strain NEG-M]